MTGFDSVRFTGAFLSSNISAVDCVVYTL